MLNVQMHFARMVYKSAVDVRYQLFSACALNMDESAVVTGDISYYSYRLGCFYLDISSLLGK